MNELERALRFTTILVCGCIACWMAIGRMVPPQIHHLNEGDRHGGRRLGDRYTVGLCVWHHVGQLSFDWTAGMHRARLGPSWAREPAAFRQIFGSGEELLEFQNALIEGYRLRTQIGGHAA